MSHEYRLARELSVRHDREAQAAIQHAIHGPEKYLSLHSLETLSPEPEIIGFMGLNGTEVMILPRDYTPSKAELNRVTLKRRNRVASEAERLLDELRGTSRSTSKQPLLLSEDSHASTPASERSPGHNAHQQSASTDGDQKEAETPETSQQGVDRAEPEDARSEPANQNRTGEDAAASAEKPTSTTDESTPESQSTASNGNSREPERSSSAPPATQQSQAAPQAQGPEPEKSKPEPKAKAGCCG